MEITDDGIGFDYGQALTQRANMSGSGLGSIHHRIELTGGICEFKSVLGAGTKAVITLPVADG